MRYHGQSFSVHFLTEMWARHREKKEPSTNEQMFLDLYGQICCTLYVIERAIYLTSVQTLMNFHAPRRGEAFHAELTRKSFDASVDLHMCRKGALDRKCAEALLALVGLLVSVNADMTHQITGFLELFGAVWTAMPSHTILLPDGT